MNYTLPQTNLRNPDRQLVLGVIDGKQAKTSTGMMDPRLFSGENSIHAMMDPETTLWSFRYHNKGILPEPLRQKFTSFGAAKKFATNYFKTRNIEIKEVKD